MIFTLTPNTRILANTRRVSSSDDHAGPDGFSSHGMSCVRGYIASRSGGNVLLKEVTLRLEDIWGKGENKSVPDFRVPDFRAMSRHQAAKQWHGRQVVDELAARGILIRSQSSRVVAEEAPGAYKDVSAVVDAAEHAGLARRVARLAPMVCVKG